MTSSKPPDPFSSRRVKKLTKELKNLNDEVLQRARELLEAKANCYLTCPHCQVKTKIKYLFLFKAWDRSYCYDDYGVEQVLTICPHCCARTRVKDFGLDDYEAMLLFNSIFDLYIYSDYRRCEAPLDMIMEKHCYTEFVQKWMDICRKLKTATSCP